jgi:hypothetical protein
MNKTTNLCFSQFTPLRREEVADTITSARQRCASEEENDQDNIWSYGRDPYGLYSRTRGKHKGQKYKDKKDIL